MGGKTRALTSLQGWIKSTAILVRPLGLTGFYDRWLMRQRRLQLIAVIALKGWAEWRCIARFVQRQPSIGAELHDYGRGVTSLTMSAVKLLRTGSSYGFLKE